MATYPGAIPSYTGFTSNHTLSQDSHAAQHNSEQGDITALATKLGTGASTPTSNLSLIGNGTGTSAWAQVSLSAGVSGVLPVANGGLGQGSLSSLTLPSANLTSSPTLTTPIIADFTTATHNHSSNATGGATLSPTTLTTNTINASGANHIALSAGTNKLVKTTVLRQDDTSNTYQVGNTVILTGNGVMAYNTGAAAMTEAVTFGITFTATPNILVSTASDAGIAVGYGASTSNNVEGLLSIKSSAQTTTGFSVWIHKGGVGNFGAGFVYYTWIAIGEI